MQSSLYKIATSLEALKETPFKKERELQSLFEANLSQIMGLMLVRSEFAIKNKRIDTLAFEPGGVRLLRLYRKPDRSDQF